jgi:hypothetical protein
MKLHFKAPFKKQKLEFRHRSVSRAASDTKGKGKDKKVRIVKKRDSVGDSLDEIHAMELEDAAKRRAERNAIRLGEIASGIVSCHIRSRTNYIGLIGPNRALVGFVGRAETT